MTDQQPTTMRRPRPRPVADANPPVDEPVSTAPADDSDDDEPTTLADAGSLVLGGWSQAQREMDATSSYAQALKPDENMQFIKFLDDSPYANYRRHWVERSGERGKYKRPYVCLQTVGKPCPLCEIGDKPQAVSSFNVALIGDEGQLDLKSWDVGGKLFNTLKGYHSDPRMGPLTKGYFAVNKTKGTNGTTSVNASVIPPSAAADYDIKAPTADELAAMPRYDSSIVEIPKSSELQEIADEMAEDD